ncbi:MAG: hypothetical protein HYZ31_12940 [Gammaproteobacteria bacterium]|jgi:hypothetical protein|nr:hypothetical protein [Gammaproteobacteria bacterium]HEX5636364.1 hypothetical protein [Gammaproteobacteria bacterium]
MKGVNPYVSMEEIAMKLPQLQSRDDIEKALDEVEYLFEVIPPELQDNAEKLISLLRDKLSKTA